MDKKKKRKNNDYRLACDTSSTVYTEEVFFKSYPDATEEDYYDVFSKPLKETLKITEKEIKQIKIKSIRRVVLDEEYLEWLQKEGKENNTHTRNEYSMSLSEENVKRLWYKHKFNESFMSGYLIVSFLDIENGIEEENEFVIKDESSLNNIRDIVSKEMKVPAENIAISNKLYKPDYFVDNLEEDYLDYMDEEDPIKDNIIRLKEIPKPFIIHGQGYTNICFRIMPIIVKSTKFPYRYTREEILDGLDTGDIYADLSDKAIKLIDKELKEGLNFSNRKSLTIDSSCGVVDFEDMVDALEEIYEEISNINFY